MRTQVHPSDEVSRITSVIDEITFIGDILALSAAVESTRADEAGKIVVRRKRDEASPP